MAPERPLVVAVTALPGAEGGAATAAAVGVALARGAAEPRGVVVADQHSEPGRPTLVSSAPARALEERLRPEVAAAARGLVCAAGLGSSEVTEFAERAGHAGAQAIVVNASPQLWRELVDAEVAGAAVLRADVDAARPLTALAARHLIAAGVATGVVPRAPGLVATRRALAGIEPGGDLGSRAARFAHRFWASQSGQAAPIALFVSLLAVLAASFFAILGAAATGASRFQRAADLAAVSAARSMRDDHHRLFLPPVLANGLPNPAHLSEGEYRQRATAAAAEAAANNGAGEAEADVSFPGALFAPTRVRVVLSAEAEVQGEGSGEDVSAAALAEAYPVPVGGPSGSMSEATGGGYSGPLATRNGEGMRPDVAEAFDAMAAAARSDGHTLIVNSGFRSDAEQAALFAANPDPRMVARPGTSLHRCATELDLGPPSAYGWLAQNATRFGFLQRYSWEAWHYGYTRGPAPCSAAGDRLAGARGDGGAAATALPAFVPARYREPLARAAARWNVPANVLAAQLLAESNFNPLAVSPAGARGIAQFMPGTAAAYGLRDPFDPAQAIDAQGRLMSDLLGQFGDVSLALAAYNAGPAPVSACSCVPPYPETRAYVARILGLLGGVGAIAPPALEVRLVG